MKSDEARTRVYTMAVAQAVAKPTTPQQAKSPPRVESAPFVIEGILGDMYGQITNPAMVAMHESTLIEM